MWEAFTDLASGKSPTTTLVATPTRTLHLLAIPYKTVMMDHDVTAEDKELAAILKEHARDDQKSAIDHLILQKSSSYIGNPDFALRDVVCKVGYDGFIRVVENTESEYISSFIKNSGDQTHSHDEVMICDADTKLKILELNAKPPPITGPFLQLPICRPPINLAGPAGSSPQTRRQMPRAALVPRQGA